MLYQYESQITEQFGDGFKVNNNPKDLMASARETVNKIQGSTDTNAHDQSSMVFDQLQNEIADNEKLNDWQQLNEKMQNPFTLMRRWLRVF